MGLDLVGTVAVLGLAVLVGLATLIGALDTGARSSAWRRIADRRRDLYEWEQELRERERVPRCADCPLGPDCGTR
jgi:hypothetical protein